MESLQRLKLSVVQSFEDCFDTAYRDLHAELAAHEARVKDAERRARSAEERANRAEEACQRSVSETDTLKQDNSRLREELRQSEIDEDATKREIQLSEIYEPERVFRKEFVKINAADFQRINDRYFELYQQSQTLIEASNDLKKRVKLYKNRVAVLQARPQRQKSDLVPDGNAVSPRHISDTGAPSLSARPTHPTPRTSPSKAAAASLEPVVSSSKLITPISEVPREQNGSSTSDERRSRVEKRSPGAHPELASTPSDPSTDNHELLPITAGAPSAHMNTSKRKRAVSAWPLPTGNSYFESSGLGFPSHPVIVKSETLSSSPLESHSVHRGPAETQDLDDVGDTVVTPTKRIRYREHQNLNLHSENLQGIMRLPSIQHMMRETPTDRGGQAQRGGILQPINSNLRIPYGTGQAPKKGQNKKSGSANRISSLTEDGDENRPPTFARRRGAETPQTLHDVRSPSSAHRLSDLLEGTTPANRTLNLRATDNPRTPTRTRTAKSPVRATMSTMDSATSLPRPTTQFDPQKRSVESSQHQPKRPSQMEAIPDDEPYRARPLQRLGLGHFKINPAYNHGLDYAYDEVIRKRDERKCASGCTRPGCCGEKFTAMARFGIPVDGSGKTMSDREILEEYLGEDKSIIDTLSSDDRENLLIEAKARIFADRFGKHRHQHHRSGTPPGFWRTEMPGTQELEDDRQEAQRLEKEKVKERYREAMRPGGRWIFADE